MQVAVMKTRLFPFSTMYRSRSMSQEGSPHRFSPKLTAPLALADQVLCREQPNLAVGFQRLEYAAFAFVRIARRSISSKPRSLIAQQAQLGRERGEILAHAMRPTAVVARSSASPDRGRAAAEAGVRQGRRTV
jgi:hypothetical protein